MLWCGLDLNQARGLAAEAQHVHGADAHTDAAADALVVGGDGEAADAQLRVSLAEQVHELGQRAPVTAPDLAAQEGITVTAAMTTATFTDQAWRSYGIVYAWPLFFYTFFYNPHRIWVIWGVVLTFALIPLLALFHGKRYCSWICGCGGLAETFGDRWRHLAPKGRASIRWEWMNLGFQAQGPGLAKQGNRVAQQHHARTTSTWISGWWASCP